MPSLSRDFFERPFLNVARELIGTEFIWEGCGGRIVEVEAYAVEGDAACHTASRPSSREFVRKMPPGTAYVYLNYGIHWLLNVLALDGIILIRALQPLHGIPVMQQRRKREALRDLCAGPGRLGCALALNASVHGRDLTGGQFLAAPDIPVITADVRIGISKAADFPWRFLESGSLWVSVPPRLVSAPEAPLPRKVKQRR